MLILTNVPEALKDLFEGDPDFKVMSFEEFDSHQLKNSDFMNQCATVEQPDLEINPNLGDTRHTDNYPVEDIFGEDIFSFLREPTLEESRTCMAAFTYSEFESLVQMMKWWSTQFTQPASMVTYASIVAQELIEHQRLCADCTIVQYRSDEMNFMLLASIIRDFANAGQCPPAFELCMVDIMQKIIEAASEHFSMELHAN